MSASVLADTRYVDDDGMADGASCDSLTATPYTKIQSAINAANPWDTIMVCPGTYDPIIANAGPPCWGGTYPAQGVVVWKDGLTIKAVDPDPANTIIKSDLSSWMDNWRIQILTGGVYTGGPPACFPISGGMPAPTYSAAPSALMIVAKNVTIDGFTISRPDTTDVSNDAMTFYNTFGILVGGVYSGGGVPLGSADYFTIKNNIFEDVFQAVFVFHSSYGKIINNHVLPLGDQIPKGGMPAPWENHVAIVIYDGWGPNPPSDHPSQYNLIAYNVVEDKGIEVGQGVWEGEEGCVSPQQTPWACPAPWPLTNLEGTIVRCNVVGDWIAVKNANGEIVVCGNRDGSGNPAFVRVWRSVGAIIDPFECCGVAAPTMAPAVAVLLAGSLAALGYWKIAGRRH